MTPSLPPLLDQQITRQVQDTRSLALSSWVASLEAAGARRQEQASQPQQPKQGTTPEQKI